MLLLLLLLLVLLLPAWAQPASVKAPTASTIFMLIDVRLVLLQ